MRTPSIPFVLLGGEVIYVPSGTPIFQPGMIADDEVHIGDVYREGHTHYDAVPISLPDGRQGHVEGEEDEIIRLRTGRA